MQKRGKFSFLSSGWTLLLWLAWYLFVMVMVGMLPLLGFDLSNNMSYYLLTAVSELLLLAPVAVYMWAYGISPRRMMGNPFRGRQVLIGAAVGVCILPASLFLGTFWAALLQWLGGGQLNVELPIPANAGELLAAMACMGITAAVVEEPMFRGIVQRGLAARLPKWPALLLTAAIFALCHFQHQGLPTLFAVGLCLGWLTWQTGSLWPSVAMHLTYNMSAVALQYGMTRISEMASDLPMQGVIDTAETMTPLMMAGSGAAWFAIGLPFMGLLALLLYTIKRLSPATAAWTPRPWEPGTKNLHMLPWILAGMAIAGGMLVVILVDFGFFTRLTDLLQ